MKLFYQGRDITNDCDIVACRHADTVGRSDFLELEMLHAPVWSTWKPEPDDAVQVTEDGYDTGKMYLTQVRPEGDRYRLWASSTPLAARAKKYKSFEAKTIAQMLEDCAQECGMQAELYGVSGSAKCAFEIRDNETAPAFAQRILRREGALLKAMNGKMIGISIAYALGLDAACAIKLDEQSEQTGYIREDERRFSGADAETVFCRGSAQDADGKAGRMWLGNLPATSDAQAAKWARGILLCENSMCERLTLSMEFMPKASALCRIQIEGGAQTEGMWNVLEARHEMIRHETRLTLFRAAQSVR